MIWTLGLTFGKLLLYFLLDKIHASYYNIKNAKRRAAVLKEEHLQIINEKTENGVKFIINGFLSSVNSHELQTALDEALKNGEQNITLNMNQVEYLSSLGISVILNAYKTAKNEGGKVVIEQPSESIKRVLTITSLDTMMIE